MGIESKVVNKRPEGRTIYTQLQSEGTRVVVTVVVSRVLLN